MNNIDDKSKQPLDKEKFVEEYKKKISVQLNEMQSQSKSKFRIERKENAFISKPGHQVDLDHAYSKMQMQRERVFTEHTFGEESDVSPN